MSDEQTLLAVLVAIYLIDCIFWIPRPGFGFTHWLGKFWNIRTPSALLGNSRGAISFANPIPPLGLATRAQPLPVLISPEGVFHSVFLKWSEIKTIAFDEKIILLNNAQFVKCASDYSARRTAEALGRIHKASESKRAEEIERLILETCDTAAIQNRVKQFENETRPLRTLCNALFFFLFLACPYLVWRFGLVATIWPIVAGIYLQTIAIAFTFSRLHKKIYPQDGREIFKRFLEMLLSAPSAIRARDFLCRPLLEPFHPLAVAKALGAETDLKQIAPAILRDLKFPALPISPAHEFHATHLLKALDLDHFLETPKATEPSNTKYCPRCLQQFIAAGTRCADCGGRELISF